MSTVFVRQLWRDALMGFSFGLILALGVVLIASIGEAEPAAAAEAR